MKGVERSADEAGMMSETSLSNEHVGHDTHSNEDWDAPAYLDWSRPSDDNTNWYTLRNSLANLTT